MLLLKSKFNLLLVRAISMLSCLWHGRHQLVQNTNGSKFKIEKLERKALQVFWEWIWRFGERIQSSLDSANLSGKALFGTKNKHWPSLIFQRQFPKNSWHSFNELIKVTLKVSSPRLLVSEKFQTQSERTNEPTMTTNKRRSSDECGERRNIRGAAHQSETDTDSWASKYTPQRKYFAMAFVAGGLIKRTELSGADGRR